MILDPRKQAQGHEPTHGDLSEGAGALTCRSRDLTVDGGSFKITARLINIDTDPIVAGLTVTALSASRGPVLDYTLTPMPSEALGRRLARLMAKAEGSSNRVEVGDLLIDLLHTVADSEELLSESRVRERCAFIPVFNQHKGETERCRYTLSPLPKLYHEFAADPLSPIVGYTSDILENRGQSRMEVLFRFEGEPPTVSLQTLGDTTTPESQFFLPQPEGDSRSTSQRIYDLFERFWTEGPEATRAYLKEEYEKRLEQHDRDLEALISEDDDHDVTWEEPDLIEPSLDSDSMQSGIPIREAVLPSNVVGRVEVGSHHAELILQYGDIRDSRRCSWRFSDPSGVDEDHPKAKALCRALNLLTSELNKVRYEAVALLNTGDFEFFDADPDAVSNILENTDPIAESQFDDYQKALRALESLRYVQLSADTPRHDSDELSQIVDGAQHLDMTISDERLKNSLPLNAIHKVRVAAYSDGRLLLSAYNRIVARHEPPVLNGTERSHKAISTLLTREDVIAHGGTATILGHIARRLEWQRNLGASLLRSYVEDLPSAQDSWLAMSSLMPHVSDIVRNKAIERASNLTEIAARIEHSSESPLFCEALHIDWSSTGDSAVEVRIRAVDNYMLQIELDHLGARRAVLSVRLGLGDTAWESCAFERRSGDTTPLSEVADFETLLHHFRFIVEDIRESCKSASPSITNSSVARFLEQEFNWPTERGDRFGRLSA